MAGFERIRGDGARAFRGHYLVIADAPGMPRDRTLEPQREVEH